ncbi:hypothetical protein EDB87DRAFT_1688631 [Lactarius vividus]|nr:hypothetical protein EDB87DRAFT_1688631 [Lactarius vividus]
MYKNMLVRTLHWLNDDDESEEFVAGIPGLYQSEAFTDNGNAQRNVCTILVALPGLMDSRESLPWNIVHLAQRTSMSKQQKLEQQRRIRACLMALFYVPGTIRSVLAPYARFLANRLGVGADADDDLHNDNARLQDTARFLADIKDRLRDTNTQSAGRSSRSVIRKSTALAVARLTQQGARASPAFGLAAQQDLIIHTPEILGRDSVAMYSVKHAQFKEVAFTQVLARAQMQGLPRSPEEQVVLNTATATVPPDCGPVLAQTGSAR